MSHLQSRAINPTVYPPVRGPGIDRSPRPKWSLENIGAPACCYLQALAAGYAGKLTERVEPWPCPTCGREWTRGKKGRWSQHAPLKTTPMRTTLKRAQSERPRWMRDRAQR